MTLNRADLIPQARKCGFTDDIISRMSVHALKLEVDAHAKKIAEATRQKNAELERVRRRQERKELKQREEQEREAEKQVQEKESVEKRILAETEGEKLETTSLNHICEDKSDSSDASDAETVIDMSHVTDTANPSDQKFARFQFLIRTKAILLSTLASNEQLVDKMKTELDNDDLALLHKCLQNDSECLAQVKMELAGICLWFEESCAEKQAMYRDLCAQLVGPSATQARRHFAAKVAKMDENLQIIRAQIATAEAQ